jgi:Arc/MetJ-type ribon-helix-helix transcriptional regulator
MTLTLDPQLEQRIQHEMELGNHHSPAEVIAHALDVLEQDRRELDRHLDESMAQIQRGEGVSGDKVREVLSQLRASRV